jgi:hypothetical protein
VYVVYISKQHGSKNKIKRVVQSGGIFWIDIGATKQAPGKAKKSQATEREREGISKSMQPFCCITQASKVYKCGPGQNSCSCFAEGCREREKLHNQPKYYNILYPAAMYIVERERAATAA